MILIEELDTDILQISLDIVIVVDNVELNETIDVENNVQDIIDNITNIIIDFGYEELESINSKETKWLEINKTILDTFVETARNFSDVFVINDID